MQTGMEDDSGDQTALYALLGIKPTATPEEIRKAYRVNALRWHPDKVEASLREEAEEKFKSIKRAYDVLSDVDKRALYDQYGAASLEPSFTPPVFAPEPTFSFPVPPPMPQPQPVPQPSVFQEPPEPRPPFVHHSSSFDPFFQPAPQPFPNIYEETFFAYSPFSFTYSPQTTAGPAPAPPFYPEYHHPFGSHTFTAPPIPPPIPHPWPVIPDPPEPPPVFIYVSPPPASMYMPPYQSPVPTPPSAGTPEEEYFPPNQRQEPPRWGRMQPQPPEPKLPKLPRKGRPGLVNRLRRRDSPPAFSPRRAWDERDAAYRRGDTSPNRAQKMKGFLSNIMRRN